jgi:Lon-like ATP-dependent protease
VFVFVTDCQVHHRRAQAYVGAFLRREPKETTKAAADTVKPEAPSSSTAGSTIDLDSAIDPTAQLYEIGTFAQVHTILPGDSADSAQLLLLGHRRIKRTAVVRIEQPKHVFLLHL